MKQWHPTFASLLVSLAVVFYNGASTVKAEDAAAEAVVTLVNSNFTNFIENNRAVLVEFYAPWCGHCQKLAPHYEAAAKDLQEKESPVVLAKVDASQENDLSKKYDIAGYPTLKFFREGKPEDYTGGRTKESIVKWIDDMTGPSVHVAESGSAAQKIAETGSVVFLGAFNSKDSNAMKAFQTYADGHRSSGKFVAFVNPKLKESEQSVTVHRAEEGESGKITSITEESLDKFCTAEKLPLFGPINGENYADYFESGRHLVWFTGDADHYKAAASVIREVAKELRDNYSFVWLSSTEFKDHAQSALGVSQFPALVVQTKEGRYVYPEHTFKTSKPIQKFIEEVQKGKVEKYLMSEEIPESNDEPVKVVVGKTFNQMVVQKDKDVFLEVYAPWCGHCKKFEPVYAEFAQQKADKKNLVVAKMDGTTNESPNENFSWNGFPTIFFVKAGTEKPILFDGERTVEGLTTFLAKHGSDVSGDNAETRDEL